MVGDKHGTTLIHPRSEFTSEPCLDLNENSESKIFSRHEICNCSARLYDFYVGQTVKYNSPMLELFPN